MLLSEYEKDEREEEIIFKELLKKISYWKLKKRNKKKENKSFKEETKIFLWSSCIWRKLWGKCFRKRRV